MSAAQQAAFLAGSGIAHSTLVLMLASMVMVIAFVWGVWVTFGTFRAWQDNEVNLVDLVWAALRASIVLMVLGFYVR